MCVTSPPLADPAVGKPVNGKVEIAGPNKIGLDELVRRYLSVNQDPRDPHARYFGAELNDRSLTPGENARLGAKRFNDAIHCGKTRTSRPEGKSS